MKSKNEIIANNIKTGDKDRKGEVDVDYAEEGDVNDDNKEIKKNLNMLYECENNDDCSDDIQSAEIKYMQKI